MREKYENVRQREVDIDIEGNRDSPSGTIIKTTDLLHIEFIYDKLYSSSSRSSKVRATMCLVSSKRAIETLVIRKRL